MSPFFVVAPLFQQGETALGTRTLGESRVHFAGHLLPSFIRARRGPKPAVGMSPEGRPAEGSVYAGRTFLLPGAREDASELHPKGHRVHGALMERTWLWSCEEAPPLQFQVVENKNR
jgi:hypothetical protein